MKDKIIIGITGVYCAGKNLAAFLLEKRGFPVLDVDKLGHEVTETEKERIVARFGKEILTQGGLVDRKRLGEKVFGKAEEMAALEDIIHPGVNRETTNWINAQKGNVCFVNAALLHRSSAFEVLDAVIIVEAPFLVRLLRARKRDHLPWIAILKRFKSQTKFTAQFFKGKTDIYRVSNPSGCANSVNSGFGGPDSPKKLEKRIDEILSLMGIIEAGAWKRRSYY